MTDAGARDIQDKLVKIPCPICHSDESRRFLAVADRYHADLKALPQLPQENTYQIVACSSCGFLFLNPRPLSEQLQLAYRTEKYDPHRRKGGGLIGWLFRFFRLFTIHWKANKVTGGLLTGSLLDIGCGTGEFIVHIKKAGWQSKGIENDKSAADAAGSLGCDVYVGDPTQASIPDGSFELITLWHSLEHLPYLSGSLDRIAGWLKSKGHLAIAVPNPSSFDAWYYREKWVAWDAPRHLYHFRKEDLLRLLQPRGFTLERAISMPLDPFYHSLISEVSWDQGIIKMLKAARGIIIGTISFIAGSVTKNGSSVLYIFTKL